MAKQPTRDELARLMMDTYIQLLSIVEQLKEPATAHLDVIVRRCAIDARAQNKTCAKKNSVHKFIV